MSHCLIRVVSKDCVITDRVGSMAFMVGDVEAKFLQVPTLAEGLLHLRSQQSDCLVITERVPCTKSWVEHGRLRDRTYSAIVRLVLKRAENGAITITTLSVGPNPGAASDWDYTIGELPERNGRSQVHVIDLNVDDVDVDGIYTLATKT